MSRLNNKFRSFKQAGSFWHQTVSEGTRTQARRLSQLPSYLGAMQLLDSAKDNLEGSKEVWVENEVIRWKPSDVLLLNPDIQERIVTQYDDVYVTFRPNQYVLYEGYLPLTTEIGNYGLANEYGQLLFFPKNKDQDQNVITEEGLDLLLEEGDLMLLESYKESDSPILNVYRQMWFLPLPADLKPHTIDSKRGFLLAGIDFQVMNGVLVLWESPDSLFDGPIVVVSGRRIKRSIMSFSYKMDQISGEAHFIARYHRDRQSPRSFQLAIAQAAGLAVCPSDGVILSVVERETGYRYVFDGFFLDALYPHTRLNVGDHLTEGYIIGEYVRVLSGDIGTGWYRETDWTNGLLLDPLCPVKGLTVPDSQIRVDAVEQTDDYHARPHLTGDQDKLSRYWSLLKNNELLTGNYLNQAVGLTSLSDAKFVNGIDFYFDNLLSSKAVIVELGTRNLGGLFHKRALTFIHNEKPVGGVAFIKEF